MKFSYLEIVATISMVGVIWNALLQSGWFIWSHKVHHRKHYTDDTVKEN